VTTTHDRRTAMTASSQGSSTTSAPSDQERLIKALLDVADAMRQQQPTGPPTTGGRPEDSADEALQEADLAYRKLGMALGRGSRHSSLFRPLFRARWDGAQKSIELPDLPEDVTVVELRQGDVTEVLDVVRNPQDGVASVTPSQVTTTAAIESLHGLPRRGGPVLTRSKSPLSPAGGRSRKATGA
jgi:hypothetical protein